MSKVDVPRDWRYFRRVRYSNPKRNIWNLALIIMMMSFWFLEWLVLGFSNPRVPLFLIAVVMICALSMVGRSFRRRVAQRVRQGQLLCPSCGYDMVETSQCPECGLRANPGAIMQAWRRELGCG